jgi:hypothetical protein
MIAAFQNNVAGLLIISDNFPKKNPATTSRMYNEMPEKRTPVLFISKNLAENILGSPIDENTTHHYTIQMRRSILLQRQIICKAQML